MFTAITQHTFLSHCFAGVITVNGTQSYTGVYRCMHAASKGTTLGSNIEWNVARGCCSWKLLTHSKHSDYMHMQLLFILRKGRWQTGKFQFILSPSNFILSSQCLTHCPRSAFIHCLLNCWTKQQPADKIWKFRLGLAVGVCQLKCYNEKMVKSLKFPQRN